MSRAEIWVAKGKIASARRFLCDRVVGEGKVVVDEWKRVDRGKKAVVGELKGVRDEPFSVQDERKSVGERRAHALVQRAQRILLVVAEPSAVALCRAEGTGVGAPTLLF